MRTRYKGKFSQINLGRGGSCPTHSGLWHEIHDYYHLEYFEGGKFNVLYLDEDEAQELIYGMQRAWTDLDFNRISDEEFRAYLEIKRKEREQKA